MTRERHLRKLEILRQRNSGKKLRLEPEYRSTVNRDRWLVNLSNTQLTQEEEDLLKLGLNFAPSPEGSPHVHFVAGVDAATHKAKLPRELSEEITAWVCMALQQAPEPQRNLSLSQQKALGTLKCRDDIVIL